MPISGNTITAGDADGLRYRIAFPRGHIENWKANSCSCVFVILTAFLYQKDQPNLKIPMRANGGQDRARLKNDPKMPGPVRSGGFASSFIVIRSAWPDRAICPFPFVMHGVGDSRNTTPTVEHGMAATNVLAI